MPVLSLYRRRLIGAAVALFASHVLPRSGFAQSVFPSRPLRLIVGFAPGGSADNVARVLAVEMSKHLGQPVVVENRTGASANIAAQAMVAAPADGYTMLLVGFSHLTNPALIASVGYEPARDLAMVSQITSLPVVAVARADSSLANLQDVSSTGKSKGGALKIGSGGTGTSSHLAAELMARAAGFKYTHVPYRGGAPAFQGLLSGDVDLTFDFLTPSMKANADAGKIKFLGVMQKERVAMLPGIRSAAEQGLSASAYIRPWQAIAVRGGTSLEIIARLHAGVTSALKNKEAVDRLEAIGTEVQSSARSQDMQKLYDDELKHWTTLIKSAGIKAD